VDEAGEEVLSVNVTYQSDDTSIASVTPTGLVTGVAPGTTSILVTGGRASARIPVRVGGPPATMDVAPAAVTVRQGYAVSLVVTVRDSQGYPVPDAVVTYSTSQPSIASVSTVGVVAGVGPGPASITVRAAPVQHVVPVTVIGHPRGTSVTAVPLGQRPFGVAVSLGGAVYVSRLDAAQLSRTDLPDTTFGATAVVGAHPTDVAFDSAGTTAYVTNQLDAQLGIIDVATNTQVEAIPLTGNPLRVAVPPGGRRLYVTSAASDLLVIERATKIIRVRYLLGTPSNGLAFHPNGVLLYGTTIGGLVFEINTVTDSARALLTTGVLQDIAVSPDGVELYIAKEDGAMEIRDASSGILFTTVSAATGAFDLAVTPDGAHIYAGILSAGAVRVIDRATRGMIRSIPGILAPRRMAFDRYGTTLVVADEAGAVHFIR
jgi:YVTN family beta-propeller protein